MYYPDKDICDRVREFIGCFDHPDLKVYAKSFQRLTDFDESGFRWVRHFCSLGSFRDNCILEAGCGFGWDAAISAKEISR
jgi:hypothetical protein